MKNSELVIILSSYIASLKCKEPLLVAINGIDGIGKTYLSKNIHQRLIEEKNRVILLSIDNFALPRNKDDGNPYVVQDDAARWYYEDAFDYSSLKELVIDPVKNISVGKGFIKKGIFSWHTDKPIETEPILITNETIVMVEGIFLFHPLLANSWNYKIFLDADFDTVLERGLDRDSHSTETRRQKKREYNNCYYAGQKIYLKQVRPEKIANIVIDYNDCNNPHILHMQKNINDTTS